MFRIILSLSNKLQFPTAIKVHIKINFLFVVVFGLLSYPITPQTSEGVLEMDASFAPGTPKDYIDHVTEQIHGSQQFHFNVGSRWYPYSTALNSGGYSYGDGITLTWSILPDGTNMPGQMGEPNCSSSLNADMDAAYGAGNWQAELALIFTEWADASGIEYVYEPQDDGAAWPNTYGVAGVRGDIRIGGCYIDGNSGVLAYNFYPDSGDMKIDSPDSWFTNSPLSTGFHNVVAHENGHGIGISHVCPFDHTKLLEPWVSQTFVGPQLDDIRGVQRLYGDSYENLGVGNDTAVTASILGTPPNNIVQQIQNVSLDNNIDEDWYQITVDVDQQIDIAVTPLGNIYEDSDQSGGCPAAGTGPFIDAAKMQDLSFELIDADGTTVLYTGNLQGAGETESVSAQALGSNGEKYIRVFGDNSDDVQLYGLDFTVQSIFPSEPQISVNPAVFEEAVVPSQQITQAITISNSGIADLFWNMSEDGNTGVMCDAPDDISWVTLAQTSGITAPDGTTAVDMTIDSTSLVPGSYTGVLCVDSNDPDTPTIHVPLSLIVEEPVPIEPPTVSVTHTQTDILLGWPNDENVLSYEVHRDLTPYFTPQTATQQTEPQQYDDTWIFTDLNVLNNEEGVNYYYVVRANYPTDTAERSVAFFTYYLVTAESE